MSVILRQTFDNDNIPDNLLHEFIEVRIPKQYTDSLNKQY